MLSGRSFSLAVAISGLSAALAAGAQARPGVAGATPQAPDRTTDQPVATGSITGRVYCADTHRPARLARINLRPVPVQRSAQSRSMGMSFSMFGSNNQTGMDGEFSLQNVKPGAYYISVSMPGYIDPVSLVDSRDLTDPSPEAQMRVRQKVQMVDVGSDAARVDVTIERGGVLGGIVRYDDGSPATNVRVVAAAVDKSNRLTTSAAPMAPATDDRGMFRITGLPPGRFYVVANLTLPSSHGPRTMKMGDREVSVPGSRLITIWAPGSFTMSEATPYEVGFGTERSDIELTITFSGLHTISGHITSTANSRFVTLRAPSRNGFNRGAQVTSDGAFFIEDVPDGVYQLQVAGQNGSSTNVVVHGADITDLNISAADQKSAP